MSRKESCAKFKTIKLLKDNTGGNLDDLGKGKDKDMVSKAWTVKEIMDKVDFTNIKKFCSVKGDVQRLRPAHM